MALSNIREAKLANGITLELRLQEPASSGSGAKKLAVLLHPWSWLGGNMHDPTLSGLAKPLVDRGYFVIRFNSRGVGKSTGRASFTGFSEAQDLEDLVQWAFKTIGGDFSSLLLAGYSHGSLISSLYPILEPPVKTSHLLLSYPLGYRGALTLFNARTYQARLETLVQHPAADVLVVYGTHDDFTVERAYDAWAADLQAKAGKGRLEVQKVDGASHFWRGDEIDEAVAAVERWLG